MVDKAEVKCRFRRSVESYEDNAYVQKAIVNRLYELLQDHLSYTPRKVLEIGCGTGLLTRKLLTALSSGQLFINDLVEEMCSKTAGSCGIRIENRLVGDIEEIILPECFDLILSASTFQWFNHPADTYKKLAMHLLPGGLLVFSTFGKNNLKELSTVTGSGLCYYEKEELKELLIPFFDIVHMEEKEHVLRFSDPVDILRHLKKTGVNVTASSQVWTKGRMERFSDAFKTLYASDGVFPLTYHPVYFVCQRKAF